MRRSHSTQAQLTTSHCRLTRLQMLNFVPMLPSQFNAESKCSIWPPCCPSNSTPSPNAQFRPHAVLPIQHPVQMLNSVPYAALSQPPTSQHAIFTFQRLTLLRDYFYQKDERAQPGNLQSSILCSVPDVIIIIIIIIITVVPRTPYPPFSFFSLSLNLSLFISLNFSLFQSLSLYLSLSLPPLSLSLSLRL
jgi:hypothetical protein